jgi:tRNA(fMet)-specific endonuclease VapC
VTESLVDTDILSFYFKGEPHVVERFTEYLQKYETINISIITFYEVLAGLQFVGSQKKIQEFQKFILHNTIFHLSEESARISARLYADLRKRGITVGTSDLLIAGIALENDLTLITNNERHYTPIAGLQVENWRI